MSPPRGPPDLHGLDRFAEAAGELVADLRERSPHRHFVNPRLAEMTVERDELGTAGVLGPHRRVGHAAFFHDGPQVGEGLDIVHHGGFAIESLVGRERRPRPHLGALPLDQGEQGGLFSADVGAGSLDREVKGESAAANVFPEPPGLAQFDDGGVDALEGVGIFRPDVENPHGCATIPARRDHPEEDAVGLLLHQIAINVGPPVALVGIADDILRRAFGLAAREPLEMKWKTRSAAAAQLAVLQLRVELAPIASQPVTERCVVDLEPGEGRGQLRLGERTSDMIMILTFAGAIFEELSQFAAQLPRVVAPLVLESAAS